MRSTPQAEANRQKALNSQAKIDFFIQVTAPAMVKRLHAAEAVATAFVNSTWWSLEAQNPETAGAFRDWMHTVNEYDKICDRLLEMP